MFSLFSPIKIAASGLAAVIFLSVLQSTAICQRKGRYVTGDIRYHNFTSKVFSNTRKLRVFVPEGYNTSKKRYPVLYLNDGQNLFDPRRSQSTQLEWGVDETVLSLIQERKIEPIIVVGIDNAGRANRANEYLPWKDEFLDPPLENPEGVKYPQFVTEEVIPFIEKTYRTKAGVRNRGIGGSSYGALISLFTVIEKPGVFGRVLLESPSFYVNEAKILQMSETAEVWPAKVYMGVGTNELDNDVCDPEDVTHEAVTDVRRLEKILKDKTTLMTVVEPCAVHSEIAWGRRLENALQFLFPVRK